MNHNQFVELDTKDKVLLSNLITKAEHNSQTYKKIDERHDHKLNLGNIYLYFSKFHNTWFVSNISFIEIIFIIYHLKKLLPQHPVILMVKLMSLLVMGYFHIIIKMKKL